MILRGRDKVGRRILRNDLHRQAWEEMRTRPYLTVRYITNLLIRNQVYVCETAVRWWIIKKRLFGTMGVRKMKGRWLITKRAFDVFLSKIEKIDDEIYPYPDRYKKPHKSPQSGIPSKRYQELMARGLVSKVYR